ncbi:acyl-CoA dehydrogenase family protein [Candidatus Poriferisocius sp.]|uniref:acyl-CoA dehydrogenase family protein n=1 Tax=Candidatus Poriferisocius sp. TaxID=3101276 RepID=UPI003B013F1F
MDEFPGRSELVTLVESLVPADWLDAARHGDEERLVSAKAGTDNPAIVRALGEAGWTAPHFPDDAGGRGLPRNEAEAVYRLLDTWEIPRTPRGSGMPLAAPTILEWSSDETKRRLLPPLATGEERWCQLFSEPGAGSDLASLATTAVRDGDEWVVNGQKVWTTFGHQSEMAMLIARTDPDAPKHKGITYFGLDMRADGVEVRSLVNMAGQVEFNEVFMTDVRVPDRCRISPIGEGWAAAMTTLGAERHALSGSKKKRRAGDEILGGKPLAEILTRAQSGGVASEAAVRQRLARAHADSWTLGQNTRRFQGPQGSITKIAKATGNQQLQELAMEILGADALAWESGDADAADWIEQFLRTRGNSIEGGTSEIQRNIVGERVLGLPREPDPFKGIAWKDVPRS